MAIPQELLHPNTRIVETRGLPANDNHDPSNVINHGGKYYFWYTEHYYHNRPGGPQLAAFKGTKVHYAVSTDGHEWETRGVALDVNAPGHWDSDGVLTAYVVPTGGRFYMFYTGVGPVYRDLNVDPRRIGVAVADNPDGPWVRYDGNPVLEPEAGAWDEIACDDANVIYRDGRWWLYYKGRRLNVESNETEVGVAFAKRITGPYTKYESNPIMPGHALTAWVHRYGVAYLGGLKDDARVYWSEDGLHFTPAGPFEHIRSTGVYCPANFGNGINPDGVTWGVFVEHRPGSKRRISRFDCDLAVVP